MTNILPQYTFGQREIESEKDIKMKKKELRCDDEKGKHLVESDKIKKTATLSRVKKMEFVPLQFRVWAELIFAEFCADFSGESSARRRWSGGCLWGGCRWGGHLCPCPWDGGERDLCPFWRRSKTSYPSDALKPEQASKGLGLGFTTLTAEIFFSLIYSTTQYKQ